MEFGRKSAGRFVVSACVFMAMPYCAVPFCSTAASFVELFGCYLSYSKMGALFYNFSPTLDKDFI